MTAAATGQICGLLQMLADDREGFLLVRGRTRAGADRGVKLPIPTGQVHSTLVPLPLLQVLEERCWSLHVDVGLYSSPAAADLKRLGALVVRWHVPIIPREGRRVGPDTVRVSGIVASLATAALVPSMVIAGSGLTFASHVYVTAIYGLEHSIPLKSPADYRGVLERLRRLATLVGADEPDDETAIVSCAVPLPGTVARAEGVERAETLLFDPSRRYTLAAIDAALSPRPSAAGRRAAAKGKEAVQ